MGDEVTPEVQFVQVQVLAVVDSFDDLEGRDPAKVGVARSSQLLLDHLRLMLSSFVAD